MKRTLAVILLATLAVVLLFRLAPIRSMESLSHDLRLRAEARWRPMPVHPSLVVLGIDDTALDRFGAWPWPRETWAEILDSLVRLRVDAVFLDVAFPEPARSLGDARVGLLPISDVVTSSFTATRAEISEIPRVAGGSDATDVVLQALEVLQSRVSACLASPDDGVAQSLAWARKRGVLTSGVFSVEGVVDSQSLGRHEARLFAQRWAVANAERPLDALPAELAAPLKDELDQVRLFRELYLKIAEEPNLGLTSGLSSDLRRYAEQHLISVRTRVLEDQIERSLAATGPTTAGGSASATVERLLQRQELSHLRGLRDRARLAATRVLARHLIRPVPDDHLRGGLADLPWGESVVPPVLPIAAGLDAMGADNSRQDPDGVLRSTPLLWRVPGGLVPASSLAFHLQRQTGNARKALSTARVEPGSALVLSLERGSELRIPVTPSGQCQIHWSGTHETSIPRLSIGAVLTHARMQKDKERYFVAERGQGEDEREAYRQTLLYRDLARRLFIADAPRPLSLRELTATLSKEALGEVLDPDRLFLRKGPSFGRPASLDQQRRASEWHAFFLAHVSHQEVDAFAGSLERLRKYEKIDDEAKRREKQQAEAAALKPYRDLVEKLATLEKDLQERLAGRTCLIGHYATSSTDLSPMPFGNDCPKIAMHAHMLNTLMQQRFIHRPAALAWPVGGLVDTASLQLPLVIAFCLILAVALPRLSALGGALVTIGLALGWMALAFTLFIYRGIWLDMVSPLAASGISYVAVYTWRSRRSEEIREVFQSYVDPRIVAALESDPTLMSELGGRERELTMIFSNVTGFTTISQVLTPRQLSEMLSAYLGPMTEVLLTHGGTRDKYIADTIAAFFGAPLDVPLHALAATLSALDQQDLLARLKAQWKREEAAWYDKLLTAKLDLSLRVGIHTGPVKVGNFGSEKFRNYSAIGESVNLAYRLVDVNKEFGTAIVASDATVKAAGDFIVTRMLDRFTVTGGKDVVAVHEVICRRSALQPAWEQLLEIHARAQELYQARDFSRAQALFERAGGLRPDDGPSRVLAQRCRDMSTRPPPETWNGTSILKLR